jgi:lipoprotein-releasing system permease protein
LGIGLAIVPMVVVIQVSGGLIRGISERYIEVGSFHLQARNISGIDDQEFSVSDDRARRVEGVKSVIEIRYGLGLLQSETGRTGVSVQAFPPEIASTDPAFKKYLEILKGDFELGEENLIMLSEPIARQLGVDIGDEMRLLTARSTSTGKYVLRQSSMEVSGIFTTGYHDLDEMSVLISSARGERLFREEGSRVLAIKVEDPFGDLEAIQDALQATLGRGWYVFSWYQLEEAMYSTFETTKNLLFLIMGVIIIVAGVNISGSLIMLVMEKEHDIAILRSSGVRARDISTGFIFLGLTAGIIGTAFGMVFGILAAVHVNWLITGLERLVSWVRYGFLLLVSAPETVEYTPVEILSSSFYLNRIPIVLRARELIFTGALSITVALLASVAPARRAANLMPVEILRRR